MAIKESREIVIEASPEEILDVIADFEAMPQWSGPHQSAEVLETGDDGRPSQVKMKVKTAGITDEQVIAYSWDGNEVSWSLVQLRPAEVAGRQVHPGSQGRQRRGHLGQVRSQRRPERATARFCTQACRQGIDGRRYRGVA